MISLFHAALWCNRRCSGKVKQLFDEMLVCDIRTLRSDRWRWPGQINRARVETKLQWGRVEWGWFKPKLLIGLKGFGIIFRIKAINWSKRRSSPNVMKHYKKCSVRRSFKKRFQILSFKKPYCASYFFLLIKQRKEFLQNTAMEK